ncbi:MAG: sugar-binding domain-containing protein [Prevotella sp.]
MEKRKLFQLTLTIIAISIWGIQGLVARPLERKILLDANWRFHLGEQENAASQSFHDDNWRTLSLPHDWSIEQHVTKDAPSGNDGGYFPTGIGWYRKSFTIPSSMKDEKVWIYFEGVYMNSTIYLNGKKIGGHPYGYTSFFCDATDAILPGKRNLLAVRVDNHLQKNCRWYTGSGIYRHVWLIHAPKIHIAPWGISVTTPDISKTEAQVRLKISVNNELSTDRQVKIVSEIDGKEAETEVKIAANDTKEVPQTILVKNPRLWDLDAPHLYKAHVRIMENGHVIDSCSQEFGIRSIRYSTNGLFLNGRSIKLNGGCVHHDNGILGAASFDRAEMRKVQMLKNAGFNAVRTAHNPPSEAFLQACDRLGMLVIDEAFDGWREAKTKYDYSNLFDSWWQKDVRSMVLRDRNHPSVLAWSIGNEVIERKRIEVITTAHKLTSEIKKFDSRPVTTALASWDKDWEIYDPLASQVDIVGYNYLIHHHKADHARVPGRIMWQTESYPKDAFQNWATCHDNSYILGDFVWTGLDYLGESGIGRYWYENEPQGEHYERDLWPCHGSYCGDLDLTGQRKPVSHYRNLLWNDNEKLFLAVKEPDGYHGKISVGLWAVWPTWESWNWPGHEGKPIEVEVYSRYPSVRLYLNDSLIGERAVGRDTEMKASFLVNYKAGTLRAEGMEDGFVKESCILTTSGEPYAIRLKPENKTMNKGEEDLVFCKVEITDKQGNLCPDADNDLSVSISGPASLQAFGNADIKDTSSYISATHKVWKGRALIVLRSSKKAGVVKLTVTSNKLKSASAKIIVR